MKSEEPINIEEFQKLSPLVKGYELRPDRVYLIICDGKEFSPNAAYALMNDIRQMHPDLNIAIVATLKPKSIEVREKDDPTEAVREEPGSGPSTPSGSTDSEGGR